MKLSVGRPTKEKQSLRDVREEILKNAEILFSQKGFHTTNLREIAKRSQISLSVLAYYFKTKEHLILTVYERHLSGHQKVLQDILASMEEGQFTIKQFRDLILTVGKWYQTEEGHRSYRLQMFSKLEAHGCLVEATTNYWTRSTGLVAELIRTIRPELTSDESLEKAILVLSIFSSRTELYWQFAEKSGQKRNRDDIIRSFDELFFDKIVITILDK